MCVADYIGQGLNWDISHLKTCQKLDQIRGFYLVWEELEMFNHCPNKVLVVRQLNINLVFVLIVVTEVRVHFINGSVALIGQVIVSTVLQFIDYIPDQVLHHKNTLIS